MSEAQFGRRLDSWKDIAAYLRRDERTAQRWESERGLPVHRLPGAKRGAVYAYTSEIDAWLAGQPAPLPERANDAQNALRGWGRKLGWGLGFGGLSALAVLAGVLLWGRPKPGPPVRVSFEGNTLVAWDARDRRAWEVEYPNPLYKVIPYFNADLTNLARVVDVDGDHRPEVLAVIYPVTSPDHKGVSKTILDCYSSDGRHLWRYVPQFNLRFASQDFDGPGVILASWVSHENDGPRIWLGVEHNVWWPSYVARVDPRTGQGTPEFVNSGAITQINRLSTADGSYLLVGGYNNEYETSFLAILDIHKPQGTSPQRTLSAFHCDNCPNGTPIQYTLFPRSEHSTLLNRGINFVSDIRVTGDRAVVVSSESENGVANAIYEFSFASEIQVLAASMSDGYWKLHRSLEQQGKINHRVEQCPDRTKPRKLRVWSPESGWSEVALLPNMQKN